MSPLRLDANLAAGEPNGPKRPGHASGTLPTLIKRFDVIPSARLAITGLGPSGRALGPHGGRTGI